MKESIYYKIGQILGSLFIAGVILVGAGLVAFMLKLAYYLLVVLIHL